MTNEPLEPSLHTDDDRDVDPGEESLIGGADSRTSDSRTSDDSAEVTVHWDEPAESSVLIQYPLSTLFLLTLAVAIGLSGGNWLPPRVFAGLTAVVANIAVFGYELNEMDDPRLKAVVISTCVTCGIAISVALMR